MSLVNYLNGRRTKNMKKSGTKKGAGKVTPFSSKKLAEGVFDAVASKRIHKTGYVRHVGGIYPSENDTVAAHLHAVATITLKLAYEIREDIEKLGVKLDMQKMFEMVIMHDHGETRSGDTGAQSIATFGVCKLHFLERDGLEKSVKGWKCSDKVMEYFDEYRTYSSPESLLVHAADVLEGLEKGLHSSHAKPWIIEDMLYPIIAENVEIFMHKHNSYPHLKDVAHYLIDAVIIPGAQELFNAYRIPVDVREVCKKFQRA